MSDEALLEMVYHSREERNLEYKQSISWQEPAIKAKIAKSAMAMANLPDGGAIVVGDRIRQARRAARPPITQTDLVARLQVLGMQIDQYGLSKIESGRRPVTDIEVLALAKALRVSVAWLLRETDTSPTLEY